MTLSDFYRFFLLSFEFIDNKLNFIEILFRLCVAMPVMIRSCEQAHETINQKITNSYLIMCECSI